MINLPGRQQAPESRLCAAIGWPFVVDIQILLVLRIFTALTGLHRHPRIQSDRVEALDLHILHPTLQRRRSGQAAFRTTLSHLENTFFEGIHSASLVIAVYHLWNAVT